MDEKDEKENQLDTSDASVSMEDEPEAVNTAASERARKTSAPWTWIAVALLAVAALVFVLVRDNAEGIGGSKNEVIGRMDGAAITKADMYDELLAQMGEDYMAGQLDQMMMKRMLDLEASSLNIDVSSAEIDEEMDQVKQQFDVDSDEEFETMLRQFNMTLEGLKQEVEVSVKLRKIFADRIQPTEELLKTHYEDYQADFATTPEQVRASHILLPTKEEADAVLAELKQGADFAALAIEKSTDTGTKDLGGDLDYFGRGVMDASFEAAAFALDKGELSDVVESAFGYHVIQVTDKIAAVIAPYEEISQQVRNHYLDQEISIQIGDWIDEKKRAYRYENLLTP